MSHLQKLILALLMITIVGLGLMAAAIWQLASLKEPDGPGTIDEERSIGLFDPHLHVRLVEVANFAALPESQPPPAGSRRYWIRLEARSSAAELPMDPSRLSVTVRAGLATWKPLQPVAGPVSIDAIPIVQRFPGPLDSEEAEQVWFVFELPESLDEAELWVSRDTWLARLIPELEATPLHDKAVYALPLGGPPQ